MNEADNKVLDLIAHDISYANYFFGKVKGLKWFFLLKGRGYFNPQTIQKDKRTNQASFWNVLDYLERVSAQITDSKNLEFGKELLSIIENTVSYSRQERKLNNIHIWWYLIKILNKLPTKLIVEYFNESGVLNLHKFESWIMEWTASELGGDLALHNIAEDLLGKFLDEKDAVPFAEVIVKSITRIQPGGKQHAFSDREDAKMAWSSYWLLQGLSKHHIKIGEKCSLGVIYDLADKLKRALEYKQQDNYQIFDIEDEVYQIKVSRVKQDNLKEGEIDFKGGVFECLVRRYTEAQLKGIDRQKDFWALHRNEPQELILQFPLPDAGTKDKFRLAIIKALLANNINWKMAEEYERNIDHIYEGLNEDYSHIWFPSLADSGSTHAHGAQAVLTISLRDILLSKCRTNKEEGMKILSNFLTPQYPFPLFKRFVLLCIKDNPWEAYGNLLNKNFDLIPDLFEQSDCEVELHDLLKQHNPNFDERLNQTIKKRIQNVPDYYKKEGPKLAAYWRYKWYSPLKENPYFTKDYEESKKEADIKEGEEFKPRRSVGEARFVAHKSPLSKEEMLSMKNIELIKFLKEFEGADLSRAAFEDKPDKEGLAEALQTAVKENSQKFTDELELFNQDGLYSYVYRILWGFRDAWKGDKPLPWETIFDFCLAYLQRPTFLDEAKATEGQDSKGRYIRIANAIVDLIEDGCRDDERAFEKDHFEKAEKIFECLFEFVQGEKYPDTQRDAVTYAINTTLGQMIEAYIIFSLRVARVKQKDGEEKEKDWGASKYDRFFEKGIESYVFLGRYLPQLKFLDESWAQKKINEISGLEASAPEWKNFMEAYLTGPYVYKDMYDWMRGNFAKAIELKFEEGIDNRLVEHLTIGYLRSYDNLTAGWNPDRAEGLFEKLLYESLIPEKRDRWPEIASFMWEVTGKREEKKKENELPEAIVKRILDFWKWTFEQRGEIKEKLGDVYPSLLCNLAELTILFDKIDAEKEQWLMLSALHVERHHFSSFFIEYLTLFNDEESIKRIGRVFLKVLEHSTPTFKQEDIIVIVEKLFKGDQEDQENARTICNTYGRRGVHFLKELYLSHQN